MDRDTFLRLIEAETENIKTNLLKFLFKDFDYAIKLCKWFTELSIKNHIIKCNPQKETVQRPRKYVYWIDFGVNVGSEFNYPHFCVVIKEFTHTAIVVPLSSVKENNGSWKTEENLIVDIGCIADLPGEKRECYALVNQIKTVSKQRVNAYFDGTTRYKLRLSDEQMDKIDGMISSLCKK